MKPIRAVISASVFATLLAAILAIPIPHYVYCSFYVQGKNSHNVYVDVPGTLEEIYMPPNQLVEDGDPIIRLSSQKLMVQLAGLKTTLDSAKVRLANLENAANRDRQSAAGREAAIVAVSAAATIYNGRQLDRERLIVRAPSSGFFLAPPRVDPGDKDSSTLDKWHGTPLEERNLGAYLPQSTFVGQVIEDMKELEAVLAIDQSEIELIQKDQPVEMLIRQIPLTTFKSETNLISPTEMESTPRVLSSKYGGDIITVTNGQGVDVPQSTKYMVTVPLFNPNEEILPGCTGVAKVRTGSQTVGQRIWRLISRTFQFEL